MIVLDIKLDNFYAFKNFHANFTYPKKIVGSTIESEYLPERTNFRYKKVNIIFGANSSGKTTFGKMIMKFFNFVHQKNHMFLTSAVCDRSKEASLVIDMASKTNYLYRVICTIPPHEDEELLANDIKLEVIKEKILKRDSYESCVARIAEKPFVPAENYIEELEKIERLAWFFEHPKDNTGELSLPNKDENFRTVLEKVLKTLDPSIKDVKILKDVDRAYVVRLHNQSIVLQHGQSLDTELFSSGTKAGVGLANILSSLIQGNNGFYYCDEKFSYIQTDVEKAVLSLMIAYLKPCDQLFFTTHNTDILDMDLPKHTYTFLRKDITNKEYPITCIEASSLLKRCSDSLRNAVENDSFSTVPALELIYDLMNSNEEK